MASLGIVDLLQMLGLGVDAEYEYGRTMKPKKKVTSLYCLRTVYSSYRKGYRLECPLKKRMEMADRRLASVHFAEVAYAVEELLDEFAEVPSRAAQATQVAFLGVADLDAAEDSEAATHQFAARMDAFRLDQLVAV